MPEIRTMLDTLRNIHSVFFLIVTGGLIVTFWKAWAAARPLALLDHVGSQT